MANGQNQRFIANPQPGTSNQPYPVGNLPPFVPVKCTLTDQMAEAILLRQQLLTFYNETKLLTALSQLNNTVDRVSSTNGDIAKKYSEVLPGILSLASAITQKNAIMSAKIASDVRVNNFYQASFPGSVQQPNISEQTETAIKEGLAMRSAARTAGIIEDQINSLTGSVLVWIRNTEIYKSVTDWLKKIKDSIFQIILPPSPQAAVSASKTIAADPSNIG